jgi:predicted solute-binding protein
VRLAVWPVDSARSLARALAGKVGEIVEVPAWQASAALIEGHADLALVPTLDVLRDPSSFDIAPDVALVGESSPEIVLVIRGPLNAVRSLGFDPRYAQEALLAAVLLREHYGAEPVFAPDDPVAPLSDRLARHDAVIAHRRDATSLPAGALVLDPGAEWIELTARPFVWGLLAARAGELDPATGATVAGAVASAEAPPGWQFTLGGYGSAGLEEFAGHLFYHGALAGLPEIPGTAR